MSSDFDRARSFVRSIPDLIQETLIKTVDQFDFVLVDYIVNKQMDQAGEDGDGEKIKPGYSNPYVRIRLREGLQVGHVDLHRSGKFHASITVIPEKDQMKIVSQVEYDKYLVKRYGEAIINIQRKYLEDFIEKYFIPKLKLNLNDAIAKSSRA